MIRLKTYDNFQRINEEEGKIANVIAAIALSLGSLNLSAEKVDDLGAKTPLNIKSKGNKHYSFSENIEDIREELKRDINMLNSIDINDPLCQEALEILKKNEIYLDEYNYSGVKYDKYEKSHKNLIRNIKDIINITNKLIEKTNDPNLSKNIEDQTIKDLEEDIFYLKRELRDNNKIQGKVSFYVEITLIIILISIALTLIVAMLYMLLTTFDIYDDLRLKIKDLLKKFEGDDESSSNISVEDKLNNLLKKERSIFQDINNKVRESFDSLREKGYDFIIESELTSNNIYSKSSRSHRIKLEKLDGNLPTFSNMITGSFYFKSGGNVEYGQYYLLPTFSNKIKGSNDYYGNSQLKRDFPDTRICIMEDGKFNDDIVEDIIYFIDSLDDKIYQNFGRE